MPTDIRRAIVIDASPAVHHKAGLARYAEELIAALADDPARRPDYAVFYHAAGTARPSPLIQSLPRIATTQSHYRWRLRALIAHLANLSQDSLFDEQPDAAVFHATEHLLPRLKRLKSVFTLHDLVFKHYPQHHLPRNRFYLQLALPLFLRRAGAVICVSEHTRRDVQQFYGLPDHKLRVIHEGVDPRFRRIADPAVLQRARDRYRLPERFILAVGTVEPRKNLATLFEALAALNAPGAAAGISLVVAGRPGWLSDDTYRAVDRLGLGGAVTFTGYVDDVDLPAVYSLADVFAFPSVYEGFGLPPLEAMACGTPVVCSDASSLPEIVGDAGLLAPPLDAGQWRQALRRALTDPGLRAEMAARGLRRAARFTWAEAAAQTRAVYQAVQAG